ncbi:hypothetical protein FJN16_10730 [Tannerella forsythia]|nr:hypothetical protein FJN16_10730 [Tannerella forsythia]
MNAPFQGFYSSQCSAVSKQINPSTTKHLNNSTIQHLNYFSHCEKGWRESMAL